VTDVGLRALAGGACATQLVSLSLGQCSGVSDAGVLDLLKGCSRLCYVNAVNCSNLTKGGVRAALDLMLPINAHFELET
jgi:hypothetical protein